MTAAQQLDELAARLRADPSDATTYAAVSILARTLSSLLTVPELDDDLAVSGAAMQLSMARDELRAAGLGDEPADRVDVHEAGSSQVLAVVEALVSTVRERLGLEPAAELSEQEVLARARARLCVDEALQELAGQE